MPSPELLAPERAERLLAGAPPETAREADVERLARELRALSAPAPASLRAQIGSLSAPRPPRRRPRLVVALAAAALVAFAALSAALLLGRDEPVRETAPHTNAQVKSPTTTTAASGAVQQSRYGAQADEAARLPYWRAAGGVTLSKDGPTVAETGGAVRDAGRAQDVDLFVALRLKDADAVSEAAGDALRITRDLGGVVRSSDLDAAGREGSGRLELSIPTRRLDEAIVRLSSLGTITEQRIATRDLQGGIDRRARRIEQLETAIRADELRLASGTLDAGEKLEVELRLIRERARLRVLTRERARLLREAAFAEVTLSLHTREAASAPARNEGIGGAARDAVDALGRAGEIAVFAGILLAPLLAVALIAWVALRARRRRIDQRLLEQPSPAASTRP